MNYKSKTFATAAIAAVVIITALNSPAEARRYKHKVYRGGPAIMMSAGSGASGEHLGAGNSYAHLSGMQAARAPRQSSRASSRMSYAPQRQVYAGERYTRRMARHSVPHVSRAARRSYAAVTPAASTPTASFGGSGLVAQARQYIGGNPTGMGALWCARFMNMVLEKSGRRGTGSNMASSFANYGQRVSGPQVGAIAVMGRGRRGGHVGIVSGIDASGNPIIISGNHNRRVAESVYSRNRIYAYVMP